jgi:hypothetical protein
MSMSYAGVVMPGNQPNMPCTHYQQLSRHKSFSPVYPYNMPLTTEGIYTLFWT